MRLLDVPGKLAQP